METSMNCMAMSDNLPRGAGAARSFPRLSATYERALWRRWYDCHDVVAADRLIDKHLNLVTCIAMEYAGCGLSTQELVGEGYIGLMRALCRYDPAWELEFVSYAAWSVRGAIQQCVRRALSQADASTTAWQGRLSAKRCDPSYGTTAIGLQPIETNTKARHASTAFAPRNGTR
jgi:RNA polymerase sigma-32 factor